jgi:hypothetical protein
MSLTRGEIAGRILRLVNKTASNPDFYTEAKVSDAIEEAMDFLAVKMFIAGEGWQDKIKYFTTVAGQVTLTLSADVSMIREVRYLFAGEYLPLRYDDGNRKSMVQETSGLVQYPGAYKVLDNQLYFNPPLIEGGDNYVQLEYTTFPKRMTNNNDVVEGQFFKPFVHWVTYWAASRLVAGVGVADPDWTRQEALWFTQCQAVIDKRNMQTTMIREFEGQ